MPRYATRFYSALPAIACAALLTLALAYACPASAQSHHDVSGVVVDADTSTPLKGVTIRARGASTTSNANGRFQLSIPAGGSVNLEFRLQGYRPVTKTIDRSTSAVIVSMKRGK